MMKLLWRNTIIPFSNRWFKWCLGSWLVWFWLWMNNIILLAQWWWCTLPFLIFHSIWLRTSFSRMLNELIDWSMIMERFQRYEDEIMIIRITFIFQWHKWKMKKKTLSRIKVRFSYLCRFSYPPNVAVPLELLYSYKATDWRYSYKNRISYKMFQSNKTD